MVYMCLSKTVSCHQAVIMWTVNLNEDFCSPSLKYVLRCPIAGDTMNVLHQNNRLFLLPPLEQKGFEKSPVVIYCRGEKKHREGSILLAQKTFSQRGTKTYAII